MPRRFTFAPILIVLVSFLFAVATLRAARADAKKDIAAKTKEAMENYDSLEYEAARRLLNDALTTAKRSKLDRDPSIAKVHLYLGIVYFAGLGQADSAKLEFISAIELDGKIQIEPAYKRPDMSKALEDARREFAGGAVTEPVADVITPAMPSTPSVDCATVTGIKHNALDTAPTGSAKSLDAYLGEDVVATKVSIMYRPEGATDFSEAPMGKDGCKYTGNIPQSAMSGKMLHYYIAALDASNKEVGTSGSRGAPNLLELTAAMGIVDNEDPTNSQVRVASNSATTSRKKTVFLAVSIGTGGGAVTGSTEVLDSAVKCSSSSPVCVAPALISFMPELGFYLSRKTSLSLVGRLGLTLGANAENHATLGPAALLRLRHTFNSSGSGFGIQGSIGGGVIRNVVEVTDAMTGANKDTVAMGPLLAGLGAGYAMNMGSTLRLFIDIAATTGIPVVKKLGTAQLGFGVQIDASLGLGTAF
jgi:hypothetical protein